jgi:hypothetical protein
MAKSSEAGSIEQIVIGNNGFKVNAGQWNIRVKLNDDGTANYVITGHATDPQQAIDLLNFTQQQPVSNQQAVAN